jgi:hypothetical protein
MDTRAVQNWADAERSGHAGEALLMILADDPRVRRAYHDWRQSHNLDTHGARVAENETPETVSAWGRALLTDANQDLARLARFISDDLRLPSYAPWLAQLLLAQFRAWAYGEMRGETFAIGMATTRRDTGLPAGRRQKGGPRTLWRNVEWFYRAEVKQPPDSIRAIAREHTVNENTGQRRTELSSNTDARSVVQEGIQRAKAVLAIVTPLPE